MSKSHVPKSSVGPVGCPHNTTYFLRQALGASLCQEFTGLKGLHLVRWACGAPAGVSTGSRNPVVQGGAPQEAAPGSWKQLHKDPRRPLSLGAAAALAFTIFHPAPRRIKGARASQEKPQAMKEVLPRAGSPNPRRRRNGVLKRPSISDNLGQANDCSRPRRSLQMPRAEVTSQDRSRDNG